MDNLLSIRGLVKSVGDFRLDDVSFDVPAGGIVGLIGKNGAGKTTLIKTALGLLNPDAGSVELFGHVMEKAGSEAGHRAREQANARIGVVFDACSFSRAFSVRDVASVMQRAYSTWDERAFNGYTAAFELPQGKKVEELSRGMGMKLMLACALSHNADLLILDEATAGLDPLAREEMLDIVRGFMGDGAGKGVLMSSHITSDLEKTADLIVCIDEGRILFSVEKDTITESAGIVRCTSAQVFEIVESDYFEAGSMRIKRNAYGCDVLVPDRSAFMGRFAGVAVDRASIDEYMMLQLEGERR